MRHTKDNRPYFINVNTRITTWLDPRTNRPAAALGTQNKSGDAAARKCMMQADASAGTNAITLPLPEGWERALTDSGTPYFIDHKNHRTTWDDPRTVLFNKKAPVAGHKHRAQMRQLKKQNTKIQSRIQTIVAEQKRLEQEVLLTASPETVTLAKMKAMAEAQQVLEQQYRDAQVGGAAHARKRALENAASLRARSKHIATSAQAQQRQEAAHTSIDPTVLLLQHLKATAIGASAGAGATRGGAGVLDHAAAVAAGILKRAVGGGATAASTTSTAASLSRLLMTSGSISLDGGSAGASSAWPADGAAHAARQPQRNAAEHLGHQIEEQQREASLLKQRVQQQQRQAQQRLRQQQAQQAQRAAFPPAPDLQPPSMDAEIGGVLFTPGSSSLVSSSPFGADIGDIACTSEGTRAEVNSSVFDGMVSSWNPEMMSSVGMLHEDDPLGIRVNMEELLPFDNGVSAADAMVQEPQMELALAPSPNSEQMLSSNAFEDYLGRWRV